MCEYVFSEIVELITSFAVSNVKGAAMGATQVVRGVAATPNAILEPRRGKGGAM